MGSRSREELEKPQQTFAIKLQTRKPEVVTVVNDLLNELMSMGVIDGFLIEKEPG